MKKTVVFGASPNPARYSNKAVIRLINYDIPVVPIGIRKGEIMGEEIVIGTPEVRDVHTITLYVGKDKQPQYYDYFLSLDPKRIIFNPGAENPELARIARGKGIEVVKGCTLVMLTAKLY